MRDKYNLVDTVEKLKELDRVLMDGGAPRYPLLAFDTETNGLHLYKATMVGFSVSTDSKHGYYVPILRWVPDEESRSTRSFEKVQYDCCWEGKLYCPWTNEFFDEFVKPSEFNLRERFPLIPALIERWFTKTNLVMHNAPFDINQTWINAGVDLTDQLLVDTGLLVHVLDENQPTALKKVAERFRVELGIDPWRAAAIEKKELDASIISNGGKPGEVWRASLDYQSKYACADTFLTFGVYEVAVEKFVQEFGSNGLKWFFEDEVMPVCKEVVVPMKRRGVFIDVPYFQKLFKENEIKMHALEDSLIEELSGHLSSFALGKSLDEAVSNQRLVKRIIQLEGLSIPKVLDKKTGKYKESLAKAAVKKEFDSNPHWIWGYILGEDEIKYSEEKLTSIKKELYVEVEGKRYQFNVGSRDHLAWLFCDRLGLDKKKLPQTDSATKDNPIPSMDAETLREHMLPKFPWVSKLLTYKKLLKLQTSYISPALELNIDGWMYMDHKQNGTTSGRFSCAGGYNLQTLPRVDDELEILEACDKCGTDDVGIDQDIECIADRICLRCHYVLKDIPRPSAIKKGFIAPPGYKIANADFESLEPKWFAYCSGEEKIKEVYWKKLDLYSKVYCDIFDTEKQYSADPKDWNFLKKIAKHKRTWVKPIVLGIPYGAEEDQVANLVGAKTEKKNWKGEIVYEDGKPVMVNDWKEGKRIRDAYLNTYTKLKTYMDQQDLKAVTFGYVETLLGRRRHLPFAKKINDVLSANGVDWKDLAHAPIWELRKGKEVNYRSLNNGNLVVLTEEMYEQIRESIKFKEESGREGGYWAYIRAMLKGDLNNSKNYPMQGGAGHTTNAGMLMTTRLLKAKGLDAWVCNQVHDEIMEYVRIDQAEQGAECLREGMERNRVSLMLDVPMVADPVVCDNLKESK